MNTDLDRARRILVTGGAGFIGSHLVRLLLRSGHEVLNVDKLTYAGNLQSLTDVEREPGYRFVKGDICDIGLMRGVVTGFRPDAIMHLAAESHVDRSISGPARFAETNVLGTCSLLQAALEYWQGLADSARRQFRFIQASTDEVYGSLGAEGSFDESSPYAPRSPYSASKAAADHFVRAWHETWGLPVIVTCSSNNYGPFQHPEKLIPTVILCCLNGKPVPVYGDGQNVRDWLYVEDHCEALQCVLRGGVPGHTYNIGGGNELRNIDLVEMICGILDRIYPASTNPALASSNTVRQYSHLVRFVDDRPGHDFRYSLDWSKIREVLGWKPRQDLPACFQGTVQWYLDNKDWWKTVLDRGLAAPNPTSQPAFGLSVSSAELK
jgi:dTDP-glucose 4,6-dehydratase